MEAHVDDPDEMFQLADLLDGVSVDGVDISTESQTPGINSWLFNIKDNVPTETSRLFELNRTTSTPDSKFDNWVKWFIMVSDFMPDMIRQT